MESQTITGIKYYDKARQYLLSSLLMAIARFALMAFIVFVVLQDSRFGLRHDLIHAFFLISGSLWVVSILLSVGLTIPLRCGTCGHRVAVITSYAKVSQDRINREKSESIKNKFINFFIPIELFSRRMHCVRCNQEYSLDKKII